MPSFVAFRWRRGVRPSAALYARAFPVPPSLIESSVLRSGVKGDARACPGLAPKHSAAVPGIVADGSRRTLPRPGGWMREQMRDAIGGPGSRLPRSPRPVLDDHGIQLAWRSGRCASGGTAAPGRAGRPDDGARTGAGDTVAIIIPPISVGWGTKRSPARAKDARAGEKGSAGPVILRHWQTVAPVFASMEQLPDCGVDAAEVVVAAPPKVGVPAASTRRIPQIPKSNPNAAWSRNR